VVRVRAGQPVRLRFDRQDNSGCTARVVFPDLRQSASLAAFGTTSMDLEVTEPGEYGWACGMNMQHGTLIVEPAGEGADEVGLTTAGDTHESARAVGVGPTLESGTSCDRAAVTLPGALRSLPIDVVAPRLHCGRSKAWTRRR
jgi:Cu+-exporting ATPase